MSRDYVRSPSKKNKRSAPPKKSEPKQIRRLPWFILGLLTGLSFIYADVVKKQVDEFLKENTAIASKQKTEPKADKKDNDVKFDFYTVLPEMEVVVPERKTASISEKSTPAVEENGTYIIQAGSFKDLKDADSLRAKLTLLGFTPSIQTVTINGNDTWHRVRIGPYTDLAKLNNARSSLKDNNINSVLMKVRE